MSMVKIEISSSQPARLKIFDTYIDISQMISTVKKYVQNTRRSSIGGQQVEISLDGFNFSIGKAKETYRTRVSLALGVKPKYK